MIDGHQHFWATARGDYGWLTSDLKPIYRDFGPADLAPHLKTYDITGTVLVQAAPTEAETAWMLELAARTPSVLAVVGWVDFEAADAAAQIAALAQRPKLRGVRPMLQDLADDVWMLRESLHPAYRAIIETGLRFDALVLPKHLGHLIRLAERLPELRIVIDHAGKPDIARWRPGGPEFRAWSANLRALAASGAHCKLSGLVTEAAAGWKADDLRPYFDVLMQHFGARKLIWGSDWPVVLLNGDYDAWRHATDALLAELPSPDRTAILGGNAAAFYGRTA